MRTATLPRRASSLLGTLLLLALPLRAQPLREAPNPGATAVDQLAIAGNACGPAALLSAFRFGNEKWRLAADALPGDTDRARLSSMIRTYGMRPSPHLGGRPRWSRKGVNVADLSDIANEIGRPYFLAVRYEIVMHKPGEAPRELLRRTHARLAKSLAKGLPPVASIRRFAYRSTAGGPKTWTVVDAHFVTIISLPAKLDRQADSFPVTYLDPWGGKRATGTITLPTAADGDGSTALEAAFPAANVGKTRLKPDEPSLLSLSAAIGRW